MSCAESREPDLWLILGMEGDDQYVKRNLVRLAIVLLVFFVAQSVVLCSVRSLGYTAKRTWAVVLALLAVVRFLFALLGDALAAVVRYLFLYRRNK